MPSISELPLSEYPNFATGDCLIMSPSGKTWTLHSLVLANASTVLRSIFDSFPETRLNKQSIKSGFRIRWKLRMSEESASRVIDRPGQLYQHFEAVPIQSQPDNYHKVTVIDLSRSDRLYDNLFRSLHLLPLNLTPELSGNQSELICDISSLIQAATFLGARQAVSPAIERELLNLDQGLWHHVRINPEAWASLACRIQSSLILRESMLHLVGKFSLKGDEGIRKQFLCGLEYGSAIYRLILKKFADEKAMKTEIERQLIEFYPEKMIHATEENSVPGRAVYATDIYLWQALTLVRQYFSSAYQANMHHRAIDGGLAFYCTVRDGKYLENPTIDRFNLSFDMSSKGRVRLVQALRYIKDEVKHLVEPLLVNTSKCTGHPILRYLTSTKITDTELPWASEMPIGENAAMDIDMGDSKDRSVHDCSILAATSSSQIVADGNQLPATPKKRKYAKMDHEAPPSVLLNIPNKVDVAPPAPSTIT